MERNKMKFLAAVLGFFGLSIFLYFTKTSAGNTESGSDKEKNVSNNPHQYNKMCNAQGSVNRIQNKNKYVNEDLYNSKLFKWKSVVGIQVNRRNNDKKVIDKNGQNKKIRKNGHLDMEGNRKKLTKDDIIHPHINNYGTNNKHIDKEKDCKSQDGVFNKCTSQHENITSDITNKFDKLARPSVSDKNDTDSFSNIEPYNVLRKKAKPFHCDNMIFNYLPREKSYYKPIGRCDVSNEKHAISNNTKKENTTETFESSQSFNFQEGLNFFRSKVQKARNTVKSNKMFKVFKRKAVDSISEGKDLIQSAYTNIKQKINKRATRMRDKIISKLQDAIKQEDDATVNFTKKTYKKHKTVNLNDSKIQGYNSPNEKITDNKLQMAIQYNDDSNFDSFSSDDYQTTSNSQIENFNMLHTYVNDSKIQGDNFPGKKTADNKLQMATQYNQDSNFDSFSSDDYQTTSNSQVKNFNKLHTYVNDCGNDCYNNKNIDTGNSIFEECKGLKHLNEYDTVWSDKYEQHIKV
ncbi:hypothetical protein SLOPH_1144 [Spraguea lophii 42_110]|uniref:Uncharacterized protein n=1 Tax=Spraguea lophii (strain 42_110) TaxID=1358809 RepID=S7W6L5_SPRLO|nr:hypothetical protein SLOPH_1144 [Spraguea lophii 42_110]